MKLKSLVLHNFGIYEGTANIVFDNAKPVVLIGGMNGHGKTTILEAILLSLYGRRSFAFAESKMSFPKYLMKYINQSNGNNEVSIELSFYLSSDSDKDTTICISRSWDAKHSQPALKTQVKKNGKHDEYLSENWDMFIETVLPCALAPLFFFDGEKIAELANSDTDDSIKKSIRSLLGIDVVDQAIVDVQRIIANKGKAIRSDRYLSEMSALEKDLKTCEQLVKEALQESGRIDIQKQRIAVRKQQVEDDFLSSGGKVVASRGDLIKRKEQLQYELSETTSKLIEYASGDAPLLLVLPHMQNIYQSAQEERTQRGLNIALEQLPSLLEKYSDDTSSALNVDGIISFLRSTSNGDAGVYNLSESGYMQLRDLCLSLPRHQKSELVQLASRRNELREQLSEIENHLETYVNESEINKKYQEILELTTKHATLSEQQEIAHNKVESLQVQYDDLKRKHQKFIENAVGVMEGADDVKRIVTYSGYTINVLQKYRERLQESKSAHLAATMTNCFKAVISKQSLIQSIRINPETLSFSYFRDDGTFIERNSLSAGEKQLLIIAMLWALGICSNKEFPIIIDTPLARLDSAHRESLIRNYFSCASKQMVLLSTDSEIFGKYYSMLAPSIDHELTLMYDEDQKRSYIETGYFGGDSYGN